MIVQRVIILQRADAELLDFEDRFWSGMDWHSSIARGQTPSKRGRMSQVARHFFEPVLKSSLLSRQPNMDAQAIVEGSRRAMRVALNRESDRLEHNLPFSFVGSTSPYIGLFGTVWGIMHSFRGLATSSQATLAAVAPGISEALIATAMGLCRYTRGVGHNRFAAPLMRSSTATRRLSMSSLVCYNGRAMLSKVGEGSRETVARGGSSL